MAFITTYCTALGVYFDDVLVEYDYQPAEWDTNTAEGIEICSVFDEDEACILDDMTEREIASLEESILESLREGRADYESEKADAQYRRQREDA